MSADPTPLSLLADSVAQFRLDVNRQFDELNEKSDRIEDHVRQTNGRVSALERWQARWEGARIAIKWLPEFGMAAAASAAGALIVLLVK